MAQQRFTPQELQELTLGQALAFKAQREKDLATEIASVTGKLSGFEYNGKEILDTKLSELADGKAIAEWNISSPYSVGQLESKKKQGEVSKQGGVLEVNNRLNNIFTDAGLNDKAGPQSSINNRLKQLLSKEEWEVYTGYPYFRERVKKRFGDNVHSATKATLTRLNAEGKKAERDFLGFKYFSGIRMSDMGDFEVSGYDPVMGTMTFIEGKSKGKPTGEKTVLLRPASIPFLESAIAGREKGTIFVDSKGLTTRVNTELKVDMPTVTTKDKAGNVKERNFTMSDYRNLEEGILLEAGLDKDERLFAAARTGTDEASKYIEDDVYYEVISPKLLKADAKLVAYSETKNAVQYFKDIGFDQAQLSDDLKTVIIAKDLVTSPRYKKMLSKEFMEGLPAQGGGLKATNEDGTSFVFTEDPALTEKYTEFVIGDYAKKTVDNDILIAQGKITLAEILNSEEYQEAEQTLGQSRGTKKPEVTVVDKNQPIDYSDLPQSVMDALNTVGQLTKRTREVSRPVEDQSPTETPSIAQAADIFGTALDVIAEGKSSGIPGAEPETAPSFKSFARKAGRVYRAGRTIYGAYMLKKAAQEQLQPSQPGDPMTLYDVGSNLVGGIQKALESAPSMSTPTQPSISPEYDEFSDIQRDLSKSKYNGDK